MEICFQTLRRWSGGGKGILTNSMRSCRKNFLLKTSTYMYPLDLAGATNLARAHLLSANQKSRWRAIHASRKNHKKFHGNVKITD